MPRRTFRHWTPRYIIDRLAEKLYRRMHPNLPWLTPQANHILANVLKPSYTGLEFGSGRSTVWFAAHLSFLTSIEHNPQWYCKVSDMLAERRIKNVRYHLQEKEDGDLTEAPDSAYVRAAAEFEDGSLDFVLVDGIYRGSCAYAVVDKVKSGGMIVIDNVNWYLPCTSRAPNSRRSVDGAANEYWAKFFELTQAWRVDWSSNGISDTAIFWKP
jgi:predicted O-methyltransferase YrrM